MSDIRASFYEAINKANTQKPKPKAKKSPLVEKVSIEQQIQNILNESNSAVIKDKVVINNQPLIDWLFEITKLTDKEIDLKEKINEEIRIINELREKARREYRLRNKMLEFTAFNPTAAAAASSSAAGAGGGTIFITVDPTTNTYVVDDYVENYIV